MESVPGYRKLAAWALVYAMVFYMTHIGKPIGETEAELVWRVSILFFGGNALEWVPGLIQAWRNK